MTNPNTNACVTSSVSIGLKCFILYIINITISHLLTMCCFIFNSWSSQAPKYLIVPDLFTSWPFILMLFVIHLDRVCKTGHIIAIWQANMFRGYISNLKYMCTSAPGHSINCIELLWVICTDIVVWCVNVKWLTYVAYICQRRAILLLVHIWL